MNVKFTFSIKSKYLLNTDSMFYSISFGSIKFYMTNYVLIYFNIAE